MPILTCEICGEEFTQESRGKPRNVCYKPECDKERERRKNSAYYLKHRSQIICKYCGISFTRRTPKRKHCYNRDCIEEHKKEKYIKEGYRKQKDRGIHKTLARMEYDAIKVVNKDKRLCLKCDKWFLSKSDENRICPKCKVRNSNILTHEDWGGYVNL